MLCQYVSLQGKCNTFLIHANQIHVLLIFEFFSIYSSIKKNVEAYDQTFHDDKIVNNNTQIRSYHCSQSIPWKTVYELVHYRKLQMLRKRCKKCNLHDLSWIFYVWWGSGLQHEFYSGDFAKRKWNRDVVNYNYLQIGCLQWI